MLVTTIRSDGCLSHVLFAGGQAAIIDPARDTAKYRELLADEGATATFVIDTHTHADHLSGARKLADETGARLVMSKQHVEQWRAAADGGGDALGIGDILRANAGVTVDVAVGDGDTLELGDEGITFHDAPGHTTDSMVISWGDRLFTGDALLIGQIGRCDLPGGDGRAMYETLFERFARHDDATLVYPGHDYEGQTVTALGFERVKNAFFQQRSHTEFEKFLKEAFPDPTGAGMQCGASFSAGGACGQPADPLRDEVGSFMDAYFFGAARPENLLSTAELEQRLRAGEGPLVLDVREPKEYEQGHVPGSINLSVHQIDRRLGEIDAPRGAPIVTICRSGKRSGWAAMFLRVAGYTDVKSVPGGMLEWQKMGFAAKEGDQP